jgi:hypothetical protein
MKIRSRLTKVALVLGLLAMNGCYSKTTFDERVEIRQAERYAYKIQLHSHTEGRGNVHNLLDLRKYEYESSYSICVNSLKGKIDAAGLVFTQLAECETNPSFWVDQRGFIEFRDDCLHIALEAEYIKGWGRKPLLANGTYAIAQVLDKPVEPAPSCKR